MWYFFFKPAASITLLEYMKIWCNTNIGISNKQNTMFVCSVIVLGYITEGWDVWQALPTHDAHEIDLFNKDWMYGLTLPSYLDKALLEARGVPIITISSSILLVIQQKIIARHFLAIDDMKGIKIK